MDFITDACIIDWAAIPRVATRKRNLEAKLRAPLRFQFCDVDFLVFACIMTSDRLFALTVFASVGPTERIVSWWNPWLLPLCPDLVFTVRRATVSWQEDGWFPVNHRPTTNGHCLRCAGEQTELKSGTFRPSRHAGCELTLIISHFLPLFASSHESVGFFW